MKKRIEIEAKFELLNVKELFKILEELEKENNAKLVEKDEIQKDTYFTPNDRNFLDKRPVAEWLRTREEKGKYSITYKNWAKEDEEKAFEYIMKIVEELNIRVGKQIFKGYPGLMLGL